VRVAGNGFSVGVSGVGDTNGCSHGGQPARLVLRDTGRVMSDANLENLQALLAPWDGRNLRAFGKAWGSGEVDMSLLDPDVAYEDTILPDHIGETYHGHDGVARAMERWTEPYEELTVELERIVGDGEVLVSIHRVHSRAGHTGIQFDSLIAYLWQFQAGKVVLFRSYWEPSDALAAAGLAE
jgi:ketosteroid isomerase-like protein